MPKHTVDRFIARFSRVPRKAIHRRDFMGMRVTVCTRTHAGETYAIFEKFPVSLKVLAQTITFDSVHWTPMRDTSGLDFWASMVSFALTGPQNFVLVPWALYGRGVRSGHAGWTLIDVPNKRITFYDTGLCATKPRGPPTLRKLHAYYRKQNGKLIGGFRAVFPCLRLAMDMQRLIERKPVDRTCAMTSVMVFHCMLYVRDMDVHAVVTKLSAAVARMTPEELQLFVVRYFFWLSGKDTGGIAANSNANNSNSEEDKNNNWPITALIKRKVAAQKKTATTTTTTTKTMTPPTSNNNSNMPIAAMRKRRAHKRKLARPKPAAAGANAANANNRNNQSIAVAYKRPRKPAAPRPLPNTNNGKHAMRPIVVTGNRQMAAGTANNPILLD